MFLILKKLKLLPLNPVLENNPFDLTVKADEIDGMRQRWALCPV